jgi:hypothetical protein
VSARARTTDVKQNATPLGTLAQPIKTRHLKSRRKVGTTRHVQPASRRARQLDARVESSRPRADAMDVEAGKPMPKAPSLLDLQEKGAGRNGARTRSVPSPVPLADG